MNKEQEQLSHGYIRLRSLRPLTAMYMFFDDVENYYCEAEFEREGLHFVRYVTTMSSDEYPRVNILFCRVFRWETKKFEKAMMNLDKRMMVLRPDYVNIKKWFVREIGKKEI